jgi:AraC-like DNA-binding protein
MSELKNIEQNKTEFFEGKLWENLYFAKGYCKTIGLSQKIILVFVIKGNIKISVNEEVYIVHSQEMFLVQRDYSYNFEVLKQTHLVTCLLHTELFFLEHAMIDKLCPLDNVSPESLMKLPINKTINDYLILIQDYIKDKLNAYSLFDLKRNEFLYLLFNYYSKSELAYFLYFIVHENRQFKEFIMNNYLNVKNVQELAALANYSTSGFIKKFQRCFNDAPYAWMQKQKARQIAVEIEQGVKSLQ